MIHDLLQKWAAAIQHGRAPDPRTAQGLVVYGAIGIGIGWWLAVAF